MKKYLARILRRTAQTLDPQPSRPAFGDVHIYGNASNSVDHDALARALSRSRPSAGRS